MRCVSGLHEWIGSDDGARCCNGYPRALRVGREALGEADRIAVEEKTGAVHGMRWERQSLRQWLDSEGLRHQLRLSEPQSLNCLRLERAGGGWAAILYATAGWLTPQRVPVPAGVLVDAAAEEAYR